MPDHDPQILEGHEEPNADKQQRHHQKRDQYQANSPVMAPRGVRPAGGGPGTKYPSATILDTDLHHPCRNPLGAGASSDPAQGAACNTTAIYRRRVRDAGEGCRREAPRGAVSAKEGAPPGLRRRRSGRIAPPGNGSGSASGCATRPCRSARPGSRRCVRGSLTPSPGAALGRARPRGTPPPRRRSRWALPAQLLAQLLELGHLVAHVAPAHGLGEPAVPAARGSAQSGPRRTAHPDRGPGLLHRPGDHAQIVAGQMRAGQLGYSSVERGRRWRRWLRRARHPARRRAARRGRTPR